MTITPADRWGPFVPGLDIGERRARLVCLLSISRLMLGPRGSELQEGLRRAMRDDAALPEALACLNALAAIDRRKVLAQYAVTSRLIEPEVLR